MFDGHLPDRDEAEAALPECPDVIPIEVMEPWRLTDNDPED